MKALLLVLPLAGCATVATAPHDTPKHHEKAPRFTSAPVVQRTPRVNEKKVMAPCVTHIPDEPPLIASRLTGIATYDIGLLEQSARDLRTALREARRLLQECAKMGNG